MEIYECLSCNKPDTSKNVIFCEWCENFFCEDCIVKINGHFACEIHAVKFWDENDFAADAADRKNDFTAENF